MEAPIRPDLNSDHSSMAGRAPDVFDFSHDTPMYDDGLLVFQRNEALDEQPGAVPEPLVALRNYFPETWLWKLARTGWVALPHSWLTLFYLSIRSHSCQN